MSPDVVVNGMKTAVVIAYYKEPDEWIRRAIDSVLAQRVPCTPFLISDGHPRSWIDELPVRHVRLGIAHGDYGDTSRGIGAALALREGFEALCFLDADNYFLPAHVERLLETQRQTKADIVTSSLFHMRPDGSRIERDLTEDPTTHTDTSCYLFTGKALVHAQSWLAIPKVVSIIDDRIFFEMMRNRGLHIVHVPLKTVAYTTTWQLHYDMIGETAPPNAKVVFDPEPLVAWWKGLSADQQREVRERLALPGFHVSM